MGVVSHYELNSCGNNHFVVSTHLEGGGNFPSCFTKAKDSRLTIREDCQRVFRIWIFPEGCHHSVLPEDDLVKGFNIVDPQGDPMIDGIIACLRGHLLDQVFDGLARLLLLVPRKLWLVVLDFSQSCGEFLNEVVALD